MSTFLFVVFRTWVYLLTLILIIRLLKDICEKKKSICLTDMEVINKQEAQRATIGHLRTLHVPWNKIHADKDQLEKRERKLSRGCWVLVSYQVSLNSGPRLQRRTWKCLSKSDAKQSFQQFLNFQSRQPLKNKLVRLFAFWGFSERTPSMWRHIKSFRISKIFKLEYGYEPCNGGSYNTHRSKWCHYIYPKHLDFGKALCLFYL